MELALRWVEGDAPSRVYLVGEVGQFRFYPAYINADSRCRVTATVNYDSEDPDDPVTAELGAPSIEQLLPRLQSVLFAGGIVMPELPAGLLPNLGATNGK